MTKLLVPRSLGQLRLRHELYDTRNCPQPVQASTCPPSRAVRYCPRSVSVFFCHAPICPLCRSCSPNWAITSAISRAGRLTSALGDGPAERPAVCRSRAVGWTHSADTGAWSLTRSAPAVAASARWNRRCSGSAPQKCAAGCVGVPLCESVRDGEAAARFFIHPVVKVPKSASKALL